MHITPAIFHVRFVTQGHLIDYYADAFYPIQYQSHLSRGGQGVTAAFAKEKHG